jgi:membrane-associated phospholipid phosphatase
MLAFLTDMDWVLGIRSEALTTIFKAVTALGGYLFSIVFLILGYWFWNKDIFSRLIAMSVLSKILNTHLKMAYMAPRPESLYQLMEVTEWSFPSGHAQHGATMWLGLAAELGQTWAWIVASVITTGVASSRVYLGVHYIRDVLAGVIVGLLMIVYFRWLAMRDDTDPPLTRPQITLCLAVQIPWLVLAPTERFFVAFLPLALFLGFWTGNEIYRRFQTTGTLDRRWSILITAAVIAIGAVSLFAGQHRWWGPLALGTRPIAVYIQFVLLGLWSSAIVPCLRNKGTPKTQHA